MTIAELFDKLQTIGNADVRVQNVKTGVLDKLETGDFSYPLVNFNIGEGNNINIPNSNIQIVMSVFDLLDKDLSDEIDKTSSCFEIGVAILSQLEYNYKFKEIEVESIEWEQAVGQTSDFLGGIQFFINLKIFHDFTGCTEFINYE